MSEIDKKFNFRTFFAPLLFISLFKLDNFSPGKITYTGLMYAKAMEIYWLLLVEAIRISRYLISENRRLSKLLMPVPQVIIWICLNKDLTLEYNI